jgi:ribonuclease P protein subunit POP4
MIKGKGYEITAKNILGHEIIGLKARVIKSKDESRAGIEGTVLNETQNTLEILGNHGQDGSQKKFVIPKQECEFEFNLGKDEKGNEEKIIVKGEEILKRPEDRAKEWKN